MKDIETTRRSFLKISSSALAIIPILAFSSRSEAATNAGLRAALKYQAKPEGEKSCSVCMQFSPGKTPKDLGGCKIMVGDTEISPQGYCMGWTKKV